MGPGRANLDYLNRFVQDLQQFDQNNRFSCWNYLNFFIKKISFSELAQGGALQIV